MEEYLNRIRKLGADDFVNGKTFNSVVQQLQHNIDLLYRSQASSVQNWNISELLFGNLMDYDQVGQKRYVNGGKLDSLEKILPFEASAGTVIFEETEVLNNEYWLRWSLPTGIVENVELVRNVVIPEALRHQTLLVGMKFMPFVGNDVLLNERYEIYVNGVYAGTGDTGLVTLNGVTEAKTIYGVYNLTGEETNLEISLVRSVTNGVAPANYTVRMSNVFTGLHTLGNSSFAMNFPTSGSSFSGIASDINSFYNFAENSVRPIPAFLINSEFLDGGTSSSIMITSQDSKFQSEFWISTSGSGNQLGVSTENAMEAQEFFATDAFSSSVTTVHLLNSSDTYNEMVFDKGNYEVFIDDALETFNINGIRVESGSSVTLHVEPNDLSTKLNIGAIETKGNSRLDVKAKDGSSNKIRIINDGVSVGENSVINITTGTFAEAISGGGTINLYDGGKLNITLDEASFSNIHGEYGFGMSLGSLYIDEHSSFNAISNNANMNLHIGKGLNAKAVELENHAHFGTKGFSQLSTSSTEKVFKARLHSSIEILDDIQSDGGVTAFTDVNLGIYSTFGSPLNTGTLNESLVKSYVYKIL